jgi:UDP-N-acetylglucosamine 4,6-dehydratase/5-epimerase
MFKDKVLMITGGTGSFGKTVLKRFLDTDVKEIRVFSRDEKKQEDMRIAFNNDKLKFYIGDVRDINSVMESMCGVDYIFHAAALKQVPSCEFYPMEAVKSNIVGAENVINAAIACDVKRAVFLSTDKAVYPVNAMGISKAMMEKLVIAKSRMIPLGGPVLCCTRYGNVMASRGSVIPLFIKQLKSGLPLTVTDPSMTRFLMSLEDSVDLVIRAFEDANQGDIFVQKAPASTVEDLALALNELFNKNNKTKIIGTRHGEKLFETLVSREEMAKIDDLGRYYRIPVDDRDLNYNKYFIEGNLQENVIDDYTSHNTERLSVEQVKELLLTLDYINGELNA